MSENLLYSLLPALFRQLDREEGRPLEALLEVLDEERRRLEREIDTLYTNWFVETADGAALLKLAGLLDVPHLLTRRAAVANTLASRSRKGSLGGLDRRLADASGWYALSAFEPPLAFEGPAPHTTLVTRVWRQTVYPVEHATPFQQEHYLTFQPMGVDQPLFHMPAPQPDQDRLLRTANMPVPLTLSDAELASPTRIFLNGEAVPIMFTDLSGRPASPREGVAHTAGVDPRTGRFVLDPPPPPGAVLSVSYAYAFTADVGGGPYPRHLAPAPDAPWRGYVRAGASPVLRSQGIFATLTDALQAFAQSPCQGTICFLDSATYALPAIGLDTSNWACPQAAENGRRLVITAADGECPCLTGSLQILAAGFPVTITLDGLWIDGPVLVGGLLTLQVFDSTLRPTGPAEAYGIRALPGPQPELRVHLRSTICGPILLPPSCSGLVIESSIVERIGDPAHPPADTYPAVLRRSTVLGAVAGVTLDADASLIGERPAFYVSTEFGASGYARPVDSLRPPVKGSAAPAGAFADVEGKLPYRELDAALQECLPMLVPHRFSYET